MTGAMGYRYHWNNGAGAWQIGSPSGHIVFEAATLTDVVRVCRTLNASLRKAVARGRAQTAAKRQRAKPPAPSRTAADPVSPSAAPSSPRTAPRSPALPIHFRLAARHTIAPSG